MTKHLGLLVKLLPTKDKKVSLEVLFRESGSITTFDDFKKDLVEYMKRKVKKFVIKNNVLTIENYTHSEINELIKYFKIGHEIKEISIDTLYNSWTNPYEIGRNLFINKLEKHLVSKEFNYFIFENSLFIKE